MKNVWDEDQFRTYSPPVKAGKLVRMGDSLLPRRFYIEARLKVDQGKGKTARLHFKTTKDDIVLAQVETFGPGEVNLEIFEDIDIQRLTRKAGLGFFIENGSLVIPPAVQELSGVARAEELRRVALAYCTEPTRGTKVVQEVLGYGSRATATLRVREARDRKLIPPPGSPPEDYERQRKKLHKQGEEL